MIEVTEGSGPIVLGLPHTGTDLPPDVAGALNDHGRALIDTDWHIHRLYAGLGDVTTVRTPIHRYVIDVNRPPDGASLYPGQATTDLCPLTDFDGREIYRSGQKPDATEVERRRSAYHAPYHAALEQQLNRVKARHGVAILYDCHSIRSHIPRLFDGTLPDFNIGTNLSTSCAKAVEDKVLKICKQATAYSTILNGRFKGGWTTRAYGRPDQGFHAIQMELAQSTYLTSESPPWEFSTEKSTQLRVVLTKVINSLTALVTAGDLT